jgi:transposase
MKFQWPKNQGEIRDITKRQMQWLLEGLQIDQKKVHRETINTENIIFQYCSKASKIAALMV